MDVYCRRGCTNVVARLNADVVGEIPCNVSWRKGCANVVVRLNDGVAGDISCTGHWGEEVSVLTVLEGGIVVAGVSASPYRIHIWPCVGREVRSSMRTMILSRSLSPGR
ncbi:hypothetical protein PgNI_06202 [Pyricularia grisea]|uniref:Uncharacterized protein n=1 Tax=Pyricularia grisea TaxID=148305 RepID=A0A6P8B5Y8_PYRGI|nr:hypothetical protein PgNI_06202 [Pyricularia grisea]TLD10761.1 hypothetical protein PgNI_06202 [Pyricularia grisea]